MPTIEVQPRPTPEERADTPVEVEVDDTLNAHAEIIEEWTAPRQEWDFLLQEGTEFGRANNVEVQVMFVSGAQSSSLRFRLDQLDAATDTGDELVLRFEENDGIAKLARLGPTGLHAELFHILTFT